MLTNNTRRRIDPLRQLGQSQSAAINAMLIRFAN